MLRPPVALVALVAAAASAFVGCSSTSAQEERPPRPAVVRARPGELRTVPEAGPDVTAAAAKELSLLVVDVYERAFLPPIPVARRGSPAPTPIPRPPLEDLFTEDARQALAAARDAFAAGEGAVLRGGSVAFSGFATVEDTAATSALLSVEFVASGALSAPEASPLRLRQVGQLLCLRSEAGWRVAGFDVSLTTERQVPAAASPPATARFMPPERGT